MCVDWLDNLLYYVGLKKINPICDRCKKNMESESSYVITITEKNPKILCDKCVEAEFFF